MASKQQHGTYVGPAEKLKGKTALLLPSSDNDDDSPDLRAQFDDIDTGFGYGWYTFSKSSFEIDLEVDSMPSTPIGCESHQADYKPHAWENYTLAELGWWVHLLTKRAEHRSNSEKRAKDLHDAGNYLSMMEAKLEEARLRAQNENNGAEKPA